jgi:hypothetical protein
MIASPINDHACLGPTTDQILAEVAANNPALVDLAARFSTIEDLAEWFRSLPQRDDNGDPSELPKVNACRPPQRFQLDSEMPNCYERTARWVGTAELIDPNRVYRLATVSTPNGLHTFPTVDGKPVILDPITRNALRTRAATSPRYEGDIETRRTRLQRLIGTDETKGARADLSNMYRAKARGETTWIGGTPIDLAIYNAERAIAYHRSELSKLDEFYPAGSDYDEDEGPGPGPFETFVEFNAEYARAHPAPSVRNAYPQDPEQLVDLETVTLTPRQAIDWIAELAMSRAHQLIGGTRRIENGHRALCGVLVLRPICVADARDVALVLALAEREARKDGLGALKVVHSTARALDQLDQLAAANATAAPRNNPLASVLIGNLLNDKMLGSWLGALTRVAGRIATDAGVEAAKIKLAGVGLSPPVMTAFEKELNKEGLTLGALAKPPPITGSLDAMTPQALAGRWLAQKI